MRLFALAAGLMMAVACAAAPPQRSGEEIPVKGGSGRICDAAKARSLVGRTATGEVGTEALRLSGAATLRWLRPGDIVTMDFREDRLNVELDANSRVKAVRCG